MTHLRKMMLEELERRNYAQTTTRLYIQTIEDFAHYFKHPHESMERGRDTLSEEDATPAQHLEPRRSCPPHRLGPDSVSSHCVDDALWHRGTACRIGSLANPRYRQPSHGHPHPRWERSSGPRCHAQSHPPRSLARLLAGAEAQAQMLVIPGRALAHRQTSHHPQGCVLRLPTGSAARRPAESGPSPHA